MKVIIEAEEMDLKNLVNEYKQAHIDDYDPEECKKYVRRKIIEAVSIDEADIRFFFGDENYVTW